MVEAVRRRWHTLLRIFVVMCALGIIPIATSSAQTVTIRLATNVLLESGGIDQKLSFVSSEDLFRNTIIPMFEAEHPNIKVEWVPLTGPWQNELPVAIAAGVAPDVFVKWGPFNRAWGAQGFLLDLTPYVERDYTDEIIQDFIPMQWEAGIVEAGPYKGERMGIPRYVDASLMYYNKSMLESNGLSDIASLDRSGDWTWDTVRDYARKLTVFQPDSAQRSQLGLHVGGTGYWFPWVWSGGGDLFNYPDNPMEFTLHQPNSIRGLEFLQAMIWEDQTAAYWTRADNLAGRVGIEASSIYSIALFANSVGDRFEWDVVPHPVGPSGTRGAWVDADQWGIASTTKHPDESWELVKFLASPEINALTATNLGLAPSRLSAFYAYMELLPDKNVRALIDTFMTARGYPWSTTVRYSDQVSPVINSAIVKSLHRNETPIRLAMEEIVPTVESIYREMERQINQ